MRRTHAVVPPSALTSFVWCFLALLVFPPGLSPQANPEQLPDSAAPVSVEAEAAVVLGLDTILTISAPVGSFTAAERAAAVTARLRSLSGDPYLNVDTVQLRTLPGQTEVVVDGVTVLAVTDADAAIAGVPRDVLARTHAQAIAAGLRQQSPIARTRIIVVGVVFALLTAIATIIILRLVNRAFPRIDAAINTARERWLPAVRIQNFELLSADQLASVIAGTMKIVRLVLMVGLLYFSIPLILSFFPWTRRYSDQLVDYVLTPFAVIWQGLLGYLPKAFALGAIVVTTMYLLRLIRAVFLGVARERISFTGFYPEWAIPTYKLVRTLVIVFAFVMAWPYLPGSDSDAFRGVGVFIGLLVSLGSATAVGNIVSGVVLTYMRPFRLGDRVRIADTEGDVIERSLLITRLRTPKNVEVTVPNAMVLGSHIINFSASAGSLGLVLHTNVTIGYDVPWRQVHDLLIAAARSVPEILPEPAPFVNQTGLSDYYPVYELNAYTNQPGRMAATYARLHEAIQDRFNEAGIEILSPAFSSLRDGNASTVPQPHTPPGPVQGFRIGGNEG